MPHFPSSREWLVLVVCGVVLSVAIPIGVAGFSLDTIVIILLFVSVLFGSIFGELRDTWNAERPFSLVRVFFRTFEWLSLAVAGYIILSVIGSNAGTST